MAHCYSEMIKKSEEELKILVVGAGIGGTSLAFWLEKFGISVKLIEKKEKISAAGFAIDIRGSAIEVIKKMGVFDEIFQQRTTLKAGHCIESSGEILSSQDGEEFGFRQGEDVEIIREDLVKILHQSLKKTQCEFSLTISEISQGAEGVDVTFSDGKKEKFDAVVGADGISSVVREKTFSRCDYQELSLGYYICIFNTENVLNLDQEEIRFEQDSRMLTVSSDRQKDIARVGFMAKTDKQLKNKRDLTEQKEFLWQHFHDLGWKTRTFLEALTHTDDLYFDDMRQIKMKTWSEGKVCLLADAACCSSPLSGQGTSLALIGAYVLGHQMKEAIENTDRIESAFEHYERALKPLSSQTQEFATWVSKTIFVESEDSALTEKRNADILEKLALLANSFPLD